jgi:hypothetical protein
MMARAGFNNPIEADGRANMTSLRGPISVCMWKLPPSRAATGRL